MPDLSAVRAIYQLSLLKHHRREGRGAVIRCGLNQCRHCRASHAGGTTRSIRTYARSRPCRRVPTNTFISLRPMPDVYLANIVLH